MKEWKELTNSRKSYGYSVLDAEMRWGGEAPALMGLRVWRECRHSLASHPTSLNL